MNGQRAMRRAIALAALALLALGALTANACRAPAKVHAALWRIEGPHGERGWLFGTIHALPCPVAWRSPAIDAALKGSDRVVLEVARIDHPEEIARTFAALAQTPGQPPLASKLPPALRPRLAAMLAKAGLDPARFAQTETWAAAIQLADSAEAGGSRDPANGIDRAVLQAAAGKPVEEFEGAGAQLAIFDRLPEAEQRALLAAVVRSAARSERDTAALEAAWGRGDVATIAREEASGLLATPGLRKALLDDRNAAWSARIVAMLGQRQRPLVAVGGGHMAGPSGLPARLARAGFRVVRVQ